MPPCWRTRSISAARCWRRWSGSRTATYGVCENCGTKIIEERLELLPYARYCTPCAEKLQSGKDINLNEGRPRDAAGHVSTRMTSRAERRSRGPIIPVRTSAVDGAQCRAPAVGSRTIATRSGPQAAARPRAGSPAPTSAEGDPDNADLEDAMGSGTHDVAIEADDEETVAYSGPAGGAVGGTPAGKRAVGGKAGRRGGSCRARTLTCPSRGEDARLQVTENKQPGAPAQTGISPDPFLNHEYHEMTRRPTGPIGRKYVLCHLVFSWSIMRSVCPFDPAGINEDRTRDEEPCESAHLGPPGPLYSWARPDPASVRVGGLRNREVESMRTALAKVVSLAMAAGLLAHLAGGEPPRREATTRRPRRRLRRRSRADSRKRSQPRPSRRSRCSGWPGT